MAIDPSVTYAGKVDNAPAEYPYGKPRNITVPGDATGTPWEAAGVQDLYGLMQNLLDDGGVIPVGTPDNLTTRQYLEAMHRSINKYNGIRGVVSGLRVENDALDINKAIRFNTGHAVSANDNLVVINLTTPIVKNISAAWTVGTNLGGLFSGAVAADTSYHLFVIYDPVAKIVDAGFDTDVNAANRPGAYTQYARVASLKTDSSGNLYRFYQDPNDPDYFLLYSQRSVLDEAYNLAGYGAVLYDALSPQGVLLTATINNNITWNGANAAYRAAVLMTSVFQFDSTPTTSGAGTYSHRTFVGQTSSRNASGATLDIPLDTSAQFRYSGTSIAAVPGILTAFNSIRLLGWRDTRGRV
jgi:hypothetical protein